MKLIQIIFTQFSLHAITGLIGSLIWLGLPRRFQKPKLPVLSLFFTIGFFIPVAGDLLLGVMAIILKRLPDDFDDPIIEHTSNPNYLSEKLIRPAAFGEGGARFRLQTASLSTGIRTQALLAINASQNQLANEINRSMLQDKNDELRLYAYTMLDKQLENINHLINETVKKLQLTSNKITQAHYKKHLASLHWELIFLGLTEGELLEQEIARALTYTLEALNELDTDVSLWIQLGKIYLRKGEKALARDAFETALVYKASPSKVFPYLASMDFESRDFASVKRYFIDHAILRDIPKLGSVAKFWSGIS